MAKINNPTRRVIVLPTKHEVPRQGELVTTNEVILCSDNWPMLNGMFLAGEITIEFDPDPVDLAEVIPVTEPPAKPVVESAPEVSILTVTGPVDAPADDQPVKAKK